MALGIMKKMFSVILSCMIVLSLAACSGSEKESSGTEKKIETAASVNTAQETETVKTAQARTAKEAAGENIAGSYELCAMVTEGKTTAPEDIELLKEKGLNCTMILKEDGKGTLDLFGERSDLTWDEKNLYAGEKTMPYTYKDMQITVTDGDSSLTFSLAEG